MFGIIKRMSGGRSEVKEIGIVRNLDQLGRAVLPKELRDALGIAAKDSLEIFTEEDAIILRKYEPGCTFCGSLEDVGTFKGVKICRGCRDDLGR